MSMMVSSPLLAVEGVSVFYGKFRAIDHVDITVGAGEIVSIIGANGAGKSTLLKAIIGQADRVEGTISFAGENIVGRATETIVASGIMLVPEGRRLFPSLTVEENLRLGWDVGRKGDIRFADIWRQFPILEERRKQTAGSLSGGQQLFALDCAGCHTIQARGGVVTGAFVPALTPSTPRQIAEAIRIGPYAMPPFGPGQLSGAEIDAIARYVASTNRPQNPGGWDIGRIGPITEGMAAWLLAVVALLLIARLLGERAPPVRKQ